MSKKIKVLVVDDSAFNRRALKEIVMSFSNVTEVETAIDGEDAIKQAMAFKPDVITLDLEMPKMDGFTFLRIMMHNFPTPTIVVSSKDDDQNVFQALSLGAVDFISKPSYRPTEQINNIAEELLDKMNTALTVNMDIVKESNAQKDIPTLSSMIEAQVKVAEGFSLFLIGSSTGGPTIVQSILASLPNNFPGAIAISQHMPRGFTRSFAERLNQYSNITVKEAADGDTIEPGVALVTPGGYHMSFAEQSGFYHAILTKSIDDKYVPSIDVMYNSAADVFTSRCHAIVLTGMGSDGKQGVVTIKERGGQAVAQSEETSVIFGMPREAIATGVVDRVLDFKDISGWMLSRARYVPHSN